jgi:hypothetical protein
VVNIGTSAQMAMVLTGADVAKLASDEGSADSQESSSFEVRPFLFEDRFLGVAASLSGFVLPCHLPRRCCSVTNKQCCVK